MDVKAGTEVSEEMKSIFTINRLALLLATITSLSLFGEEGQRYLVATKGRPHDARLRIVSNADAAARHRLRTFRHVDAFAVTLTPAEAEELRRSTQIEFLTPVVERSAEGIGTPVPNAPYLTQEVPYGITMVRAPEVWSVTRGENVHVAVLDTGIDPNHPDLVHAYAGGVNMLDPQAPPFDDNNHGTHVSGTIAAADNAFGVVGVAPAVRLWGVKVLDRAGNGSDEAVTAGVEWVIDQNRAGGKRWVINLSLGSNRPSEVEERAIRKAIAEGIVVVASAGNRTSWIRYPARYPGVIAVGAVDSARKRAEFSSHGPGLSIMAPGNAVPSTIRKGTVLSADVRLCSEPCVPDSVIDGWGVIGSPFASLTGTLVDAGLGRPQDFPADMAGKVAFMQRGEIMFREKARNAKDAGAIAAVIWNNREQTADDLQWTMVPAGADTDPAWKDYVFPLTIGISQDRGQELRTKLGPAGVAFREDEYGNMNGTSMAAPHVTGIAALILSAAPEATPKEIRYALEKTAHDLDNPGWDSMTGHGLVDALQAARYVAWEKFNAPRPIYQPSRRRAVR